MNKHEREQEKMLAEAFHGDWSTGKAAKFAQRAAETARRSRGRKACIATSAAAGVAAALLVSLHHPSAPPQETLKTTTVAQRTPGYEIISDDELLSQLKDRPLFVLRGENGEREFLLLTTPDATIAEPDDS